MKNIHTFHLLPLLVVVLLLLAPAGCLGRVLDLPCPSTFQTVDHQYCNIITAHETAYHQINTTMYVRRPQRGLTVVLGVEGTSGKYYTEFSLGKECFQGDWQWWELWAKVKHLDQGTDNNQVWAKYKLQVRTSKCVKLCIKTVYNMKYFVSLHVWATGASQWTLEHPGNHCGNISQWKRGPYQQTIPECTDVHPPALSTTTAKPSAATDTPSTTTDTPSTTTGTPSTTTDTPSATTATLSATTACTLSRTVPAGVVGGVIAGTVLLTVVGVVAMVLVMKRDGQATVKGVSVRP